MTGGEPERDGVELRVHGVGGDPPQAVLGMPFREDAVPRWRTAGERVAVADRRIDERVRVFTWGELTSRSRWFALWTLLLPFTLVNVAGWAGRGSTLAIRGLAFLCGLVVTGLSVGWLALTGVLLLGPAWLAWGLLLGLVVTLVLGTCSSVISAPYRAHRPPWWRDGSADHGILDPPTLSSPRFFDNGRAHRQAWTVHVAVAALTWAAIGWAYWSRQDSFQADLERGIAWTTIAGLAAVLLLAVVSFEWTLSPSRWRWSAPAMAAGGALFLAGGVPSALVVARNGGWEGFRGRQAFVFFDLYGATLVAGVLASAIVAGVVLSRKSPAEQLDPGDRPEPGRERLLGPEARRAARTTQVVRHVDLVATVMMVTFLAGGAIVFADRVLPGEPPPSWRQFPGHQLFVVGLLALAVVVWFVLRDLWRNTRSLEHRRKIGQLWDVLTFWPRTVHPLGVRTYAERAVPELQHYLSRHHPGPGAEPARWTVTAHSQGSVLAYAALAGIPSTERSTASVDLFTFGSPLAALYAKVFPRYFAVSDFHALREELGRTGPPGGEGGWRNVFRVTDAVGREVFADSVGARDPALDMVIADPNQLPPTADRCAPDAEQDPPIDEENPTIWGHNGYRRSRPFKTLVYRSRFGRDHCGA